MKKRFWWYFIVIIAIVDNPIRDMELFTNLCLKLATSSWHLCTAQTPFKHTPHLHTHERLERAIKGDLGLPLVETKADV